MASRSLDDLSPRFKPLAVRLIELASKEFPVTVIETKRTLEEHKANLAKGVSWIDYSRHIDGDAIDLAPTELLKLKNWAPYSPLWQRLGQIGKSLGLRWGGNWKKRDMCHFEYKETK